MRCLLDGGEAQSLTTILALVDNNILVWRARTVKNGKNHAFAKACWENGHHISPMRQIVFSCFLLVFGS